MPTIDLESIRDAETRQRVTDAVLDLTRVAAKVTEGAGSNEELAEKVARLRTAAEASNLSGFSQLSDADLIRAATATTRGFL